jgi:hypothetical protein
MISFVIAGSLSPLRHLRLQQSQQDVPDHQRLVEWIVTPCKLWFLIT